LNSNEDLVSVVIPVYNAEKFLKESIESVLNQTYKNLEIIAVDDGSTDDSLKILKRHSEEITIISQQNQGLGKSLITGLEKTQGKWIKWFSPDDKLLPNAIRILVEEARKLPENTIVYSNWDLIDENEEKLRSFSESNYNALSKFEFNVRLLDGQQINVNTTLIPKSLFEKGCIIRELDEYVVIDYDFFLRAALLFDTKFHLVTDSLVKYRIHTKQLSHQNISKSLSYLDTIRNETLSKLDQSTKEKYIHSLNEYQKRKPIIKKTLELGLKLASKTFPEEITEKLVVFYLNKIRRGR